jgi:hypothetical protein
MSGPQPGPYPQYPGGGGMPPAQPQRPLPDTVRNAFYLMLGGAALQVLGIIAGVAQIGEIRKQVREQLADDAGTTQSTVDAAVTTAVVFIIIIGLVGAGLWIWMAFANKAGKNWARITGTVFFGIATLGALFSLVSLASDSSGMAGSSTVAGNVISLLGWAVGLAVVILLWHNRSSEFFKPQAEYGYGYQPPGQTYPSSGPAPGQTYPPQGPPPPPQQPPAGPPPPGGGPGSMPPPQ